MAYVNWTRELVVGVDAIDAQHRKLVDLINTVHDTLANSQSRVVLIDVFGELIEYTWDHFKFEEAYYEAAGYPRLETHKALHDELRDAVVTHFGGLGRQSDAMVAAELLHFLKDWLVTHIAGEDKRACTAIIRADLPKRATGTH